MLWLICSGKREEVPQGSERYVDLRIVSEQFLKERSTSHLIKIIKDNDAQWRFLGPVWSFWIRLSRVRVKESAFLQMILCMLSIGNTAQKFAEEVTGERVSILKYMWRWEKQTLQMNKLCACIMVLWLLKFNTLFFQQGWKAITISSKIRMMKAI